MSDWETKLLMEAKAEAETEGLPATTPHAFYAFAEDPFHPTLPLRADIEERKKFFGSLNMAEFIKGFTKKILAAYQAKLELYEEFYQDSHEYGPNQVPNLVLCGPPSSGRTTICRYVMSLLNKPALWGNGAAVITSTREWATLGSSVAEGMQRWLDPEIRQAEGRTSLAGLKILFIDDADLVLDFLELIHTQIQDLANGPVVIIPILSPIGYDFLAEYHCEREPNIDRLFGLSAKAASRTPLTVWVRRWSLRELNQMLKNRLYITGGKIEPFTEKIIDQICRHSLGLPGEAITLAENLMRRSERFGLKTGDESFLEFFTSRLGITTAERILRGALEERQVVLTSGFEVPAREDASNLSITGTRKDIIEVMLRQMVVFGTREVRGELLADPKEHEATQRTIDVKRSTLSYHLTNLVKEGVLSESRHGRAVGYRIRNPIEASLQMVLSSSMLRVVL